LFRLFEYFWIFCNFNRSQNPRFQTTLILFIDENTRNQFRSTYAQYLHIPALSHAILCVESMQVSQNWELYLISQLFRVAGQSSVNDLKVSAEVCMPLINTIVTEIKNGTYPQGSFLNVDVPTDAAHHKVNQQQWSEVKKCTAILELYGEANLNALSYTFTSAQTINYGPDMQKC